MNTCDERSADISDCGLFRWTLTRRWDDRPVLLVVMFNPSTADGTEDDPTIRTLMQRASRVWGYGGIVVVNVIPLRSPSPADAIAFLEEGQSRALVHNEQVVEKAVRSAGSCLLAWGALAGLSLEAEGYLTAIQEDIETAADDAGVPLFCMDRTSSGMPKHPLARGKHRVPNDAPLQRWKNKQTAADCEPEDVRC